MKTTLILAGALMALIAIHAAWSRPPRALETRWDTQTGSLEISCKDGSQPVAQTNDNEFDYDALIVTCGEVHYRGVGKGSRAYARQPSRVQGP